MWLADTSLEQVWLEPQLIISCAVVQFLELSKGVGHYRKRNIPWQRWPQVVQWALTVSMNHPLCHVCLVSLVSFAGWTVPEEEPQDAGHFNTVCHCCRPYTCSVWGKVQVMELCAFSMYMCTHFHVHVCVCDVYEGPLRTPNSKLPLFECMWNESTLPIWNKMAPGLAGTAHFTVSGYAYAVHDPKEGG